MDVSMKPLICFDMDETILYSNKSHIKAFNKTFINNNLKPISEKKLSRALQGEESEIIIKKFYPTLSDRLIKKLHLEKRKLVINKTYKYARSIKNSVKILRYLKNNYNLVLLSNCTHKEVISLLKGAKISSRLFYKIIGKDEVKHAKPYPDEIFKAERLLHEKALFMIGDSIQDIKAARKAKIKIILVLTGNTPKSKIIKSNPNYILNSIAELKKIL